MSEYAVGIKLDHHIGGMVLPKKLACEKVKWCTQWMARYGLFVLKVPLNPNQPFQPTCT